MSRSYVMRTQQRSSSGFLVGLKSSIPENPEGLQHASRPFGAERKTSCRARDGIRDE